jgi:hypothetical protein
MSAYNILSRDSHGAVLLLSLVCLAGTTTSHAAEHVVFSFDDHAIPFKSNLKLTLVSPDKHAANPVVPRGPRGSVDAFRAQFYGSVIRVDGKFRMWYVAGSDDGAVNKVDTSFRPAYAESGDGIHWVKPQLGLTEFAGNKRNNLVEITPRLDMARLGSLVCFVLHEPEDKDPSRRYKMLIYGRYYDSTNREKAERQSNTPTTVFPFFSADGLRWRLAIAPPKGPWFVGSEVPFPVKNNFELGGLYKFDGIYYAAGQEMWPDISLPDGSRVRRTMVTHWSGDFVHWSHDRSFSFQRYGYRTPDTSLEEAHEPAGVWNRGNVLVATYGLWHGAREIKDRRMDLGLLVSNDGIHFREPIPDFAFLKAGNDGAWDQRGLVHGQGYWNVGDKTYIYYGAWDPSHDNDGGGAIGLATMRRDGFGFLSARDAEDGVLTTAPIANTRLKASLYLNADGLSQDARLVVELIDKLGSPIRGYSGADAATIQQSGLRVRVAWAGRDVMNFPNPQFRVRIRFTGPAAAQARFYAAYIE